MRRLLKIDMTGKEKSIHEKKKKGKEVFPRTAESASFITYMARMEEKDTDMLTPF